MAVRCPTPGPRLEAADCRPLQKWDTRRRLNHFLFKVNRRSRALAMIYLYFFAWLFLLPSLQTPCANVLVSFGWYSFFSLSITENYSARSWRKPGKDMRDCTLAQKLPNPFPLLGSQHLAARPDAPAVTLGKPNSLKEKHPGTNHWGICTWSFIHWLSLLFIDVFILTSDRYLSKCPLRAASFLDAVDRAVNQQTQFPDLKGLIF